jgi:hypothetical protein
VGGKRWLRGPPDFGRRQRDASEKKRALVARIRRSVPSTEAPDELALGGLGEAEPDAVWKEVEVPQEPSWLEASWAPIESEPDRRASASTEASRWIELLLPGKSDLADLWDEFAAAARSARSSVRLVAYWPSPAPDPLLAWSLAALGCGSRDEGQLRVAFLNVGRGERTRLAATLIPREKLREFVDLSDGRITPHGDALLTAANRLRDAPPPLLPIDDLVPVLTSRAGEEGGRIWDPSWPGFLKSVRGHVRRQRKRESAPTYAPAHSSDMGAAFGFVVPQVSKGNRRVQELRAIPAPLDLVVLDLSSAWAGPATAIERLAEALRDMKEAFGDRCPPLLALVGNPRVALACAAALRDLRAEGDIVGSWSMRRVFRRGSPGGEPYAFAAGEPDDVHVQAIATSEGDIVAEFLALARETELSGAADVSSSLAQAAWDLSAMSTRVVPFGAGVGTTRTFVDAAADIRAAIRENGAGGLVDRIEAVIEAGLDLADNLMLDTPAKHAFDSARRRSAADNRILFVVEHKDDLGAGPESANFVVTWRREAVDSIRKGAFDELVFACRADDAVRSYCEAPALPRKVSFVFPPAEASSAARIDEIVGAWVEMTPLLGRLAALRSALPRRFGALGGLADMAGFGRRDRQGSSPSGPPAAHEDIHVVFDDGFETWWSSGSQAIVVIGMTPRVKSACDLQPGDRVVLLPEGLRMEIAREMNWTVGGGIDPLVVSYKRHVRDYVQRNGSRPSHLVEALRRSRPLMVTPSQATVRYWLAAADEETGATPHAPDNKHDGWFDAFASLLGIPADLVGEHYRHICDQRIRNMHGGRARKYLVERFLFDPYNATIHYGVTQSRVDELRRVAMAHAREVANVDGPMEREAT